MENQPDKDILTALQVGRLSVQGEFMWGSNYTFLLQVEHNAFEIRAVYKPTRGARPLWDFPSPSLAHREVAAYLVSEALEWHLVPPTVYRADGPLGPGSIQLFVDHDPEYHYFSFTSKHKKRLRPVVLFDVITNNADRKGSHVLIDPDDELWLIDHGICFHTQNKLRTVIWDFAGQHIPEDLSINMRQMLDNLLPLPDHRPDQPGSQLAKALLGQITEAEVVALYRRTEQLLKVGCFPNPDPDRRHYPWPPM